MNDGYDQPGGDLPLPPPSSSNPGAPPPPGGTASYGAGSGDLPPAGGVPPNGENASNSWVVGLGAALVVEPE
jgi:hypothetical protein